MASISSAICEAECFSLTASSSHPISETPGTSTAYDDGCRGWERELLGSGDWRDQTLGLGRDGEGEIQLPSPEFTERYVQLLNETELFLLRAKAYRLTRSAVIWRIPRWLVLGYLVLWLLVAYPLVRFGIL